MRRRSTRRAIAQCRFWALSPVALFATSGLSLGSEQRVLAFCDMCSSFVYFSGWAAGPPICITRIIGSSGVSVPLIVIWQHFPQARKRPFGRNYHHLHPRSESRCRRRPQPPRPLISIALAVFSYRVIQPAAGEIRTLQGSTPEER